MVLKLVAGDPAREQLNHGRVTIGVGGEIVEIELAVPEGKVSIERLLPILQQFTNFLVDRAERVAAREGRHVSCNKGCGACCRQLVPVSQSEARALGRLVEAMPEPRRSEVRRRFELALLALHERGLVEEIDRQRALAPGEARPLGLKYFQAGVACPFLEDEACSIHPDRPLACRQYLVTSPPENCADPKPGGLKPILVDGRPTTALLTVDREESGVPWLPLVYSVIYHGEFPEPEPKRTAPELLQDIFARLKAPEEKPAPEGEGR